MTAMTKIQRDALALARTGDWRLADAIELQERFATHRKVKERQLYCGLIENGRMRYLRYVSTGPCQECDGTGEVECSACGHTSTCDECDGTGEITGAGDLSDIVVDLNGALVDIPCTGPSLTRDAAEKLIALYQSGRLTEGDTQPNKEATQCA